MIVLAKVGMLLCLFALCINAIAVIYFRNTTLPMDTIVDKLAQKDDTTLFLMSREIHQADFLRITSSRWLGIHVWPTFAWTIIAFLQTWAWFRSRYLNIHRWLGRAFLLLSALMIFGYLMMFVSRETILGTEDFYVDFKRPDKFFTFRAATLTATVWWIYCMVQTYKNASSANMKKHKYWASQFIGTGCGVGLMRWFIVFYSTWVYPASGTREMTRPEHDAIFGYTLWAGYAVCITLVHLYYSFGLERKQIRAESKSD